MFNFLGFRKIANIKYLPKFYMDKRNSFYLKLETTIYILLIVSPVDIIPEAILGIGILDDMLILTIFLNRILVNLDRYKDFSEHEDGISVDYEYVDEEKDNKDKEE